MLLLYFRFLVHLSRGYILGSTVNHICESFTGQWSVHDFLPFPLAIELTLQCLDWQSRILDWICRGASQITEPKVEIIAVINNRGDGTFGICSYHPRC